jgi:hypothetical protein
VAALEAGMEVAVEGAMAAAAMAEVVAAAAVKVRLANVEAAWGSAVAIQGEKAATAVHAARVRKR